MQDALRTALAKHRDWLVRLRWVTFAERALAWGSLGGCALMFTVAAVLASPLAALLSVGGHLLLLLAVLVLVPRRFSTALLGIVLLSLLNFSIASLAQYALLTVIAWTYFILGLVLAAIALAAWPSFNRRWQAVADYRSRDDFRWLLTAAPLYLRWRMHNAIHELYEETAESEEPAGKS